MLAQIIPFLKLPKDKQDFDYLIPTHISSKIQIGHIVKIPFHNRIIRGVVVSLRQSTKFNNLKHIQEIESNEPLFTSKQISLINKAAQKHYFSPSILFKHIAPPFIKKKHNLPPYYLNQIKQEFKIEKKRIPTIQKTIKKIKNSPASEITIKYQKFNEVLAIIYKIIKKKKRQILIITPWLYQLEKYIKFFQLTIPYKQIAVLHKQLNKNQYYQNWQSIKNNQAQIIISNRIGIFAPFNNLELIIIDNEQSEDFSQNEQQPYFDPRNLLVNLQQIYKISKIIKTTPAPSLETIYQAKTFPKKSKIIDITQNSYSPSLYIIDLHNELILGKHKGISYSLKQYINNSLQKNKKVLLFENRKGIFTSRLCLHCFKYYICSFCKRNLYVYESYLWCVNCLKSYKLQKCPHCNVQEYKDIGYRNISIKKTLKEEFPDSNILLLDKEHDLKNISEINNANIILASSIIYKYLDYISNLGIIAIINLDNLLNNSEFRIGEKVFTILINFKNLSVRHQANFVIQTYNPNNIILNSIREPNEQIFYREELNLRKVLCYPPFFQLIRIKYKANNQKEADQAINDIYQKLTIYNKTSKIKISTPYRSFPKRKKFFSNILIRYKKGVNIHNLIKIIPDKYLLEVNPQSLMN